ncbi:MAG: hypothetical protein AAGA50_02805 [Pseudomonadota bacterium]
MTRECFPSNALIVIGGASGAGKSNLARRVAKEFDVPQYELDRMFNRMKKPFEKMETLNADQRKTHRNDVMTELAGEVLHCFANLNTMMILEGGWISPLEVKGFTDQGRSLVSVFLGYCGSGKKRLEGFQKGNLHWSAGKALSEHERTRVERFFDKQITKSMALGETCRELGLKFVDTTEESGFEGAFQYLKSEIKDVS